MKILALIYISCAGLLSMGCANSTKLPRVTSFWLEYGPEKIEPQSYRCMIKVIDLENREYGKLRKSLLRILVFRNKDDSELASFEEELLLPDAVSTKAVWSKTKVQIKILSRDGKNEYFAKSLTYIVE